HLSVEKKEAYREGIDIREFMSCLLNFSEEKTLRQLHKNTCPVASLAISADSTPVSEVLNSLNPHGDNVMAFLNIYVTNKTYPARTCAAGFNHPYLHPSLNR